MLVIGSSLVYAPPVIWRNNEPQDLTTILLLGSIITYGWVAWCALREVEFPTEDVVSESYAVQKKSVEKLRVASIKRVGKTA